MITEKLDEILEATWKANEKNARTIDQIREKCAVNFNHEDLHRLEELDLIKVVENDIQFTENGEKYAEQIIRRHRLAEVLVNSILQLKNAEMEEVACKMEHSLIPEVEESICILLGHPKTCPDGNAIPPGKCCAKTMEKIIDTVIPLSALKPKEKGKITFIKPFNHNHLHRLQSLGLHPGIIFTIHAVSPAFCIKFENIEIALDKELADRIFVWKIQNSK